MIPKLVEKDLLNVLFTMRGFCQKDKGSAGADPRKYKGGSVRWSMVLLAMIPKLVERDLLNVLFSMRGFCQKNIGSASQDPKVSIEYFPFLFTKND